jgi:hypothetical protein
MEEKGEADYLWRRRKQTIAGVEECTWMPSCASVRAKFRMSTGLSGLWR